MEKFVLENAGKVASEDFAVADAEIKALKMEIAKYADLEKILKVNEQHVADAQAAREAMQAELAK